MTADLGPTALEIRDHDHGETLLSRAYHDRRGKTARVLDADMEVLRIG
jgi:hypothetical protein